MASSPTLATTNPITSSGPVSGADPSTAQTSSAASNMLTAYSVYHGTVKSVNYQTRTMVVTANMVDVPNVTYAAGVLSSFFGLSDTAMPSPGANVLLFYIPGNSYALGAQASLYSKEDEFPGCAAGDVSKEAQAGSHEALQPITDEEQGRLAEGLPYPTDMFPGEAEFGTGAGPFVRMLFNLAQMSGGGLASIETHLLNDMVRIVDNYFAHHHVGGDDLIWSNGRCNSESHFTGYPHEAEGKESEEEPLAETSEIDGVYDPVKSCQNPASDTGRWRLSTYKGFLADMLHVWVTDPTEAASTYMEESWRAGKARTWIGSDGTVMVQSVGGVHIEVTPRIIVPAIKYAWNDPEFDAVKAMESLDKSFLKIWGEGPNWDDLKVAVWQMRCYSKYITLWHSLARWKQMEAAGYCQLQTEKESPAPELTSKEKDKEAVNPDGTSTPGGQASITLLPDGSLSVISGGDTSVIMNQGNIQFNAPGNIEINAGGTVSITGKNVSAKSLENMELVSLAGGLYVKARSLLHALCEKGRIWLKSDAEEDNTDPGTWPADKGEPVDPEMAKCGVILESTRAKALVTGYSGSVLASSGPEAHVHVQATGGKGELKLFGNHINIFASGMLRLRSHMAGLVAAVMKLVSSDVKIGEHTRITPGGITTDKTITGEMLRTAGANISSLKFNVVPEEPVEPDVESEKADEIGDEVDALQQEDIVFQVEEEEGEYEWQFPEWKVGTEVMEQDSLKAGTVIDRCLAQPEWQDQNFAEVTWDKCGLEGGHRTNPLSYPWPGKYADYFEFSNTRAPYLGQKWDQQFTESDICTIGDMAMKPYRFMVLAEDKLTQTNPNEQ